MSQFTAASCYATTRIEDNDVVIGSFEAAGLNETVSGYIITDKEQPVSERVEYDENLICLHAKIQGQGVNSPWNGDVTFMDQCVALTKYFHNQLFKLTQKKWIFTRVTLNENINFFTPKLISISLKKKLGNRITQSEIYLDNTLVGIIEFSVK